VEAGPSVFQQAQGAVGPRMTGPFIRGTAGFRRWPSGSSGRAKFPGSVWFDRSPRVEVFRSSSPQSVLYHGRRLLHHKVVRGSAEIGVARSAHGNQIRARGGAESGAGQVSSVPVPGGRRYRGNEGPFACRRPRLFDPPVRTWVSPRPTHGNIGDDSGVEGAIRFDYATVRSRMSTRFRMKSAAKAKSPGRW
jgi:hypothetical protein